MAFSVYNCNDVTVSLCGAQIDPGQFAPDNFLSIAPDEDEAVLQVGAGGGGCVSWTNNKSATITLRLLQDAPGNKTLLGLSQVAKSLQISLFAGKLSYSGDVWIQKRPTFEYARDAGIREWVFRCYRLEVVDTSVPLTTPT